MYNNKLLYFSVVNRFQAYQLAGAALFKNELVSEYQSSSDIARELKRAVNESLPAAKKICKYFEANNPERTALNVYCWIRKNIVYQREPGRDQTAKTLSRLLSEGYGDCKHYSTFAAAIFKALKMPVYFRIINQTGRYNHIYTVLKYPNGRVIYCDAVYPYFDAEPNYLKNIDIKI